MGVVLMFFFFFLCLHFVLLLFMNGTATQKSLENIPNYKLKTVHSFILKHIPWCNLKPDPYHVMYDNALCDES